MSGPPAAGQAHGQPATDAELAALVADAKALKARDTTAQEPGQAAEAPAALRDLLFPELVAGARDLARAGWRNDSEMRAYAERWSRWALGADADAGAVEALGIRHLAARLVNREMGRRPEECINAEYETGAEFTHRPGVASIRAFVHSGVFFATIYGSPRHHPQRVFIPAGSRADEDILQRRAPMRRRGEESGIRWVGPRRRFEVMEQLLREGEMCGIAADTLGGGEGVLMGRPVRTTRAPAALAMATGAPIVAVVGWSSATSFGVRVSNALDPAEHSCQEELHQAVLDVITDCLDGDPGQLLGRFPAVELAQLVDQRRELHDQLNELRADYRAAQRLRLDTGRARAEGLHREMAEVSEQLGAVKRLIKQ